MALSPTSSRSSGAAAATDGWTDDSAENWTYASASTFTIAGVDKTAVFTPGTRLKFTQTTVKYGIVASSAFSTDTTVTIIVNTDYVLANAAITTRAYSYADAPAGYPGWFTYAPTFTGFSVAPTVNEAKFAVTGRTVFVTLSAYPGTSNAGTLGFTGPVLWADAVAALVSFCRVQNAGAFDTGYGFISNDVSLTPPGTWSVTRSGLTAFQASANKGFYGQFFYSL